ncbi:pathogen-associated molecular patterns-induced protein A70 [Lycium barbarum]|uniref:pathogen-associated molecular patterns-induced protein A70 n=1 Tax=Lycium barbarum TaxID=112863 RepID=UPI00293EE3B0|nr:pathogen-associated molecular patterns-induced protein A70 [Lycium barbarum]
MSSSLKPYYHTTKVEEADKKSERPMEYFTRENNIKRPSSVVKRSSESPNSTAMNKPPVSENKAAPPKKLERKQSEDINESAENFINKFKQQLLLQRLESIENYEEMLKRGT